MTMAFAKTELTAEFNDATWITVYIITCINAVGGDNQEGISFF